MARLIETRTAKLALAALLLSAAAPAQPQQTTASFGDWILRCVTPEQGAKACEVVEVVQQDGKPVAQVAIGRAGKEKGLNLAVLVPPSVSFARRATLSGPPGDGDPVMLEWQRCIPGGCMALVELPDATLNRMRVWLAPGRVSFVDGAGRAVDLPVSPTGLGTAVDALAKENGG